MYKSKSDLPETLKNYLPDDLQKIYLETYQKSWEQYEDYQGGEAGRHSVAHRNAMMAIRRDYFINEEDGKWYRRGEKPEKEEEKSLIENLRDIVEDL